MKRALTGIVSLAAACASPAAFEPSTIFTEDAERFAALLERSSSPDASALQSAYLDPATPGVEIFTPHRIESAQNLAARIAEKEARYRHAANVCRKSSAPGSHRRQRPTGSPSYRSRNDTPGTLDA